MGSSKSQSARRRLKGGRIGNMQLQPLRPTQIHITKVLGVVVASVFIMLIASCRALGHEDRNTRTLSAATPVPFRRILSLAIDMRVGDYSPAQRVPSCRPSGAARAYQQEGVEPG